MRAAARHIEAGGVGYNKGYTTLEAFLATDPSDWSVMPFLDLRGHVFNDGKLAANAGLGARATLGCRVYGLNAYYDYRNSHHKGYNQVGAGLETLGDTWDFRVNGYLPVGKKVSKAYDVEFAEFSGHSILVHHKFRYAMKGIDGEVGFHFGKTSNFDFYAAAGPYYFKGDMGKAAIGGKARLAASYKEYITVEVSDSYDAVFHNNAQGQLTLSFPFGPRSTPKMKPNCCPNTCDFATTLATRMVQPVARQEIIVLDNHKKKSATDDFVIFVDNLSSSLGTFESPYSTLLDAEENSNPGDIIYVFPGNGTTDGMDEGIILKDNQKFWGSGVDHALNTNLGTIVIPALTGTSPQITNTIVHADGHGVLLAANNEVSGFLIDHTAASGIYGTDPGNVSILASIISYSAQASGQYGIELYPNVGEQNILIDDVSILNNVDEGIIIYSDDTAQTNITVSNSNFSGNTNPLRIEGYTDSSTNATIFNNLFTANEDAVFFHFGNFSTADLSLSYNTVSGTYNNNGMDLSASTNATLFLHIDHTVFTNNDSDGINIALSNSSTSTINMDHCTFTYNDNPIDLETANSSIVNFTLTDSIFANNVDSLYLYTDSDSSTPSTFYLADNWIEGTTDDSGLDAEFYSGAPIQFTAVRNTITDCLYEAYIDFSNTTDSTLVLTDNRFEYVGGLYGGGAGLWLYQDGASLLNAALAGNTFQQNEEVGLRVTQNNSSSELCLDMRNNTSTLNDSYGYYLNNGNSGIFNVSPCNADLINTVGLFDNTNGTIGTVESCPSGGSCPP
jgi:hypothetical protein